MKFLSAAERRAMPRPTQAGALPRPKARRGRRQRPPADRTPASVWRYRLLVCEHYTTPEELALNAVWKPKGKDAWCHRCQEWVLFKPKPKPVPLPVEPMF